MGETHNAPGVCEYCGAMREMTESNGATDPEENHRYELYECPDCGETREVVVLF